MAKLGWGERLIADSFETRYHMRLQNCCNPTMNAGAAADPWVREPSGDHGEEIPECGLQQGLHQSPGAQRLGEVRN